MSWTAVKALSRYVAVYGMIAMADASLGVAWRTSGIMAVEGVIS